MRRLFAALALLAAAATAVPAQAADKLLVVVTSADSQDQGMAMVLAGQALRHGTQVRVLLCGDGGRLAVASEPSPTLQPSGKSPRDMLKGLIANGVTAQVCGLFLPNSPYTPADLIEGVSPVKPPVIGDYMADPEVRYFTF